MCHKIDELQTANALQATAALRIALAGLGRIVVSPEGAPDVAARTLEMVRDVLDEPSHASLSRVMHLDLARAPGASREAWDSRLA
jgi:hypothetical protein